MALARLLDIAVIAITLQAVLTIHYLDWLEKQTWWLLIAIIGFELFAELNDLYKEARGLPFIESIKRIVISWVFVVLTLLMLDNFYLLIDPLYKTAFSAWCVAVPVEIVSWHLIVLGATARLRKLGRNSQRVAILGVNELGFELERIFTEETWMGLRFAGFFDDRQQNRSPDDSSAYTVAGDTRALVEKAKKGEVDIVYIVLPLMAENRIKDILAELADTTLSVYFVPNLFAFDLLRSNISYLQGVPVVSLHDTPFYGVDGAVKRCFDIAFSLAALTVIAIPLALIALAIKLTSPGNVIFKQRRYGFNGQEIIVWKFRSMTVAEDGSKVVQATKNDARITPLGAFLRRTSLDELPQFINVLQGRMSIVGPRPHAVAHNEYYRGQIKGYMLRHKVKPGITGLAQVSGYRGETDTLEKMEGRIKYDLEYIRDWSLWLDVKIILWTILKGFVGKNAY